jgi:hypothetical protein
MEPDISPCLVSCTIHFLRKLAIVEEVSTYEFSRMREQLGQSRMRDPHNMNHLTISSFGADRAPRPSPIRSIPAHSSLMSTRMNNWQRDARYAMKWIEELMHVHSIYTADHRRNHCTATEFKLSLMQGICNSEARLRSLRGTLESKLRCHKALRGPGLQTTCNQELSKKESESVNSMNSCMDQMIGPSSVSGTQDSVFMARMQSDEDRVNILEKELSSHDFHIEELHKDTHVLTQRRSEYLLILKTRVVHLTARLSKLSAIPLPSR